MASYKQTEYEVLRRRCAALHQQGWKQVAIAQASGLTQGWFSRTLTKYCQHGQDALARRKPDRATPNLTDAQLAQSLEERFAVAVEHRRRASRVQSAQTTLKNRVFLSLQELKQAVLNKTKILEKDWKLVIAFFHEKKSLSLKTNSYING